MCGRGDVSQLLKFCVFFFNFVFWCAGVVFIVVGAWAFAEKHRYTPSSSSKEKTNRVELFDIIFDLTILVIILGAVIFIIAFAGCVGALRQSIFLLKFFCYFLGAVLLFEIVLAIFVFVFARQIQAKLTEVLQVEGLLRYRDDDDLRNFIDWTQKTFECCGFGMDGYRDWSYNQYFNCTRDNPSMERCGVPYSCCIRPDNIEETIINTQCGHKMQELPKSEAQKIIYTSGCIQEMIYMAQQNLYLIGGVALGFAFVQVLGIFLAKALANQIKDEI